MEHAHSAHAPYMAAMQQCKQGQESFGQCVDYNRHKGYRRYADRNWLNQVQIQSKYLFIYTSVNRNWQTKFKLSQNHNDQRHANQNWTSQFRGPRPSETRVYQKYPENTSDRQEKLAKSSPVIYQLYWHKYIYRPYTLANPSSKIKQKHWDPRHHCGHATRQIYKQHTSS